jgi:hypothetical protein
MTVVSPSLAASLLARARNFAIPVLALLPIVPGCLSTRTESPVAESLDSLGISIRGIRESNLRLAYREGLVIERAADSIIAQSNDQTIRLNAQLWKIYSIPVIRQIYSQSDPLLSAADALAFTVQCKEYFTSGIGKDRFGPYQQIAIDAVSANEERLIDLNQQRLSAATSDTMFSRLSRWAARHPLSNHVFERPSILNELDSLIARQDNSIGTAIGRIADDVDDLSGRLSILSAQLPREARWQAEYLLTDIALKERLGRLDSTLGVLTTVLGRVDQELSSGGLVVNLPDLQLIRDGLQEALVHFSSERAILVTEIERIRLATLNAGEEAANRSVADWIDRTESIVNRVLIKVGVFVSLVLGMTVVLLLYLRRTRRF